MFFSNRVTNRFNLKSVLAVCLALCLSVTSSMVLALVNINTATQEELAEKIDGVGIKKAAAIIAYRKANGPFKHIDELAVIKGIGQKILDKNRQNLTVKSDQ